MQSLETSKALTVRGKFLYCGDDKVYLKATRAPEARAPFNTVWMAEPTRERLDTADADGLRVVVDLGLVEALRQWFAGQKLTLDAWLDHVRHMLADLHEHPAIVAYDVGGPVPMPLRQWLGPSRLRQVLRQACLAIRVLLPDCALTATCDEATLPLVRSHVDFLSCVLEAGPLAELREGLARLQHQSQDLPLVVWPALPTEVAEDEQTTDAEHRIRLSFLAGCAGLGLPALPVGTLRVLTTMPFGEAQPLPRMSVVVCVFNGEDTIEECLHGLSRVDYPDFQVIVVDDGSRDGTLALANGLAARYGFLVVALPVNGGLSAARNAGMEAANGEIVAYLDADAFPDVHWLRYLAMTFLTTKHAIIGGPNLNPLAEGPVSDCVDKAPGNPNLVMADVELADHVPGCNLAVRRSFLQALGGFDAGYRGAGDDVVFCWRVLQAGGTLGVSYGAMVWHHRRPTVRAFLRQQRSYGCGEAWLSNDWPERFNSLGHQVRAGSAPGIPRASQPRGIYQGRGDGPAWVLLATMPEWPLLLLALALLSSLGVFAWPLGLFLIPLALALAAWLGQAWVAAARARLRYPGFKWRLLTAYLHLAQPVARLRGRMSQGLTPWRRRCPQGFLWPRARVRIVEVAEWTTATQMADAFSLALRSHTLPFVRGSEVEWEWQVEGGLLGGVRAVLDKSGTQMVVRLWGYAGSLGGWLAIPLLLASVAAWMTDSPWVAAALWLAALVGPCLAIEQMGAAMAAVWPITRDTTWHPSPWDRFKPSAIVQLDEAPGVRPQAVPEAGSPCDGDARASHRRLGRESTQSFPAG